MAKITFDSVVSGFKSVAQIVANFDSVATELNSKVLYRDNPEGEPNQMENNLDMNSNRILNLPVAIGSGEPITLAQAIDIITEIISGGSGGGSSLYYSTEFITLQDGQVQVQFDTDTTLSNFSISGPSADNGKIFEGRDYSISHSIRTLTLNNSYPEGTVIARYREGSDTSLTPEDAAVSAQSAEDWAIYPEDALVPTASGGNLVDEYSAKHWASKAITESGLSLPLLGGTVSADIVLDSGGSDTPGFKVNDPVNNTNGFLDMFGEELRWVTDYQGAGALVGMKLSANGSNLTVTGGVTAGSLTVGTGAVWTSGTGTPEAVVTAPVGSLYSRTDGGAGTTLYVKETGAGNTGWAAK